MNKSDIFWQTYLNLEKEMIEVSRYIFITDEITVRQNGTETTQYYDLPKITSCHNTTQ